MPKLREEKARKLEASLAPTEREIVDDGSFTLVSHDGAEAERTGYSNYSYWGSTLSVFLKNRLAVCLLVLLTIILLFTFIQPFLPGQYPASFIINHPITKKQLSNVSPSLTTVKKKVSAGTALVVTPCEVEGWSAVTNILSSIPRRETFTVVEYLGEWVRVVYQDMEGYVVNDFTSKLKLPDDPTATPYSSQSNFQILLFLSPEDYSNNGTELFVETEKLTVSTDGLRAVTNQPAGLRTLPATNAFWFGTNNTGQDLWALVWSGTRTSLFIGFMVALVEAFVGIVVGLIWGYVRRLDRIMTEIYNVIDNIPTTIVLILMAYILRPGLWTLIFAMCLTAWVGMARFIRNQIVIIRDRDYNLASRCLGASTTRIIIRNLLPYLVSVIMLRMALAIPSAIGSEVFITYIGLGLPVSIPSLGNLINVGRKLVSTSQSYQLVFPAIVLSIVTISFYIIGNAFADAADPKNHV